MRKICLFIFIALCFSPRLFAQSDIYYGSWSGTIEPVGLEIVFNIGKEASTFEVPAEMAKNIPIEVENTVLGVKFVIPAIMAYFEGMYLNKSIVGKYSQGGDEYPLTLKPYTPKEPNRPQTPKEPFAYKSEEVQFSNGEAILAGTLCTPENYTKDKPIVIFVTGSGAQDRDEELMGHRPFWVLADALANAGIASLRYDDRGFAKSTGDRTLATTDTLAVDALKGIEYLKSLGYQKVGVIGHSEGGTIAFMLGAQKAVDFIVSLAGMAEDGRNTILHQTPALLRAQGADEKSVEQGTKQVLKQMETQAGLWGKRFLELDPSDFLKDVKCPILALNGENDKNVIVEYNIPIIKSLVPHAVVKTYPTLNHLFQPSIRGISSEYYTIETTIQPEVIEDVINFILNL